MCFVGDEIYVVTASRVFDCFDCVLPEEWQIVFVLRFFEVGGPGVIVSSVGYGFRLTVCMVVIVGLTCHHSTLDVYSQKGLAAFCSDRGPQQKLPVATVAVVVSDVNLLYSLDTTAQAHS